MALTKDAELRQISTYLAKPQAPIGASAAKIWESAMCQAKANGYIVKVGDTGGVGPVIGVAEFKADNSSGAAGAKSMDLLHGVFSRPNSSTDPVTQAYLGKTIYAEDDEKVSIDASKPVAGTMYGFTEDGEVIFTIGAENEALAVLSSSLGILEIPVRSFVDADGDPLVKFADGASTVPGWNLADSKAFGLRWNNHGTPDPVLTSVGIPADLDPNQAMVLHVVASKTGATLADAVTWLFEAFFQSTGLLHDADADAGGTSSAMTGDAAAKTIQDETLTIAAADVLAGVPSPATLPGSVTLTMQPTDGKLDTDDVIVHRVFATYTKRPV